MSYKMKKQLAFCLALILLLSGIQAGSAAISGNVSPFHGSSHTPSVHRIIYWLHHDVSTEERLGTRSARLILEHCILSRGRGFCRMPDILYPVSRADSASCPPASAAMLHRQEKEPYTHSWMIRYIHDQDGEKEGARPLI